MRIVRAYIITPKGRQWVKTFDIDRDDPIEFTPNMNEALNMLEADNIDAFTFIMDHDQSMMIDIVDLH